MNDTIPTADAAVAEIASGIEAVRTHVGAFDQISAGIAEIAARHPLDVIVGDIASTKGMARAVESRAAWRDPRIRVEKARKAAKAPLLDLGRTIDAFAAGIEARLRLGEEHYDRQIKAEEARKAAERAERERIDRLRIERHERAIDEIRARAMLAASRPADEVAQMVAKLEQQEIDAEAWEEFADRARVARRLALDIMRAAHASAVLREAEEARRAAERAEQERQAQALAAQQRALAEQQAELARQRAEIEQQRAAIEAERLAREAAAQQAAQQAAQAFERVAQAQANAERVMGVVAALEAETPAPEPETMRLGQICGTLGFTVTEEFLAGIGFDRYGTQQRAVLYRASDWPAICDAIAAHVRSLRDL
jgi:hypothetical protein